WAPLVVHPPGRMRGLRCLSTSVPGRRDLLRGRAARTARTLPAGQRGLLRHHAARPGRTTGLTRRLRQDRLPVRGHSAGCLGTTTRRPDRVKVSAPDPDLATTSRRQEVLQVLQRAHEPLTTAQIAERLGVHKNTVRFHLESLAESALV